METYRLRSTSGLYGNKLFWWRFSIEFFRESKHSFAFLNGCPPDPYSLLPYMWFLLHSSSIDLWMPSFITGEGNDSTRESGPFWWTFLFFRHDRLLNFPVTENSINKSQDSHILRKHLTSKEVQERCASSHHKVKIDVKEIELSSSTTNQIIHKLIKYIIGIS